MYNQLKLKNLLPLFAGLIDDLENRKNEEHDYYQRLYAFLDEYKPSDPRFLPILKQFKAEWKSIAEKSALTRKHEDNAMADLIDTTGNTL